MRGNGEGVGVVGTTKDPKVGVQEGMYHIGKSGSWMIHHLGRKAVKEMGSCFRASVQ